jgi:2-dehydropantoate 2-reductase
VPKSVWVAGVGGIGGVVAYKIAREGADRVTAIDGWQAHLAAIADPGLMLRNQFDDTPIVMPTCDFASLGPHVGAPDVVFVAVKSQETPAIAERLAPLIGPATAVVSLQNGLNVTPLAEHLGAERVIGAVVMIDGGLDGPGVVRQERPSGHGTPGFMIGEADGSRSERIQDVARILTAVAPTVITDSIVSELWSKLIRNCMVNAVCAVTDRSVGDMLLMEPVRRVALGLAREMTVVAHASGVDLMPWALFDRPASEWIDNPETPAITAAVLACYPATEELWPSMLQDIRKGRPTEIDFMNGWVADTAADVGVQAPLSAGITAIVHAIERGESSAGRGDLAGTAWAEQLLASRV